MTHGWYADGQHIKLEEKQYQSREKGREKRGRSKQSAVPLEVFDR